MSIGTLTLTSGAVLILALAAVLFATLRSPLKDDVAWLLHVARDWLGGRRLYVDIVEVNPPLIVWLSAIPVLIADSIGASAGSVAVSLSAAFILACSWWCAVLLRSYSPLLQHRAPVFTIIAVTLLAIPGVEFGQREHLLIAAALPYLCLAGCRLKCGNAAMHTAILAGVLAGLGCALKPRYGFAFALLETVTLWRGIRLWRPEIASFLAALLAYVIAVLVLNPEYVTDAIPLTLMLYGASDVSLIRLLDECRTLLAGEALALGLLLARARPLRTDGLFLVLAVFACGATLTCLVQGRDWFYHRIPATVAIVLALGYWAAAALSDRAAPTRCARLVLAIAACVLAAFGHAAVARLTPRFEAALAPETTTEAKLEQLIRQERSRSYMAFSQSLSVAFPVVDEAGVTWTSRFDSMWALRGELWRAQRDAGPVPSSGPVRQWIAADFLARAPDLVVVDDRDRLDYVGVLTASNGAFARAWAGYEHIATIDGSLRVFKRAAATANR